MHAWVCVGVDGWNNTTNQCTFPPRLAGHTISAANGREKKMGFMLNTDCLASKKKNY
jgi:hypothetical protein